MFFGGKKGARKEFQVSNAKVNNFINILIDWHVRESIQQSKKIKRRTRAGYYELLITTPTQISWQGLTDVKSSTDKSCSSQEKKGHHKNDP